MAERLSCRSANRVLLVESGGENRSPFIAMPRGFGRINGNPEYNWMYKAQPTGGGNRSEYWLRGRGLGGSSAVNGSVYVRGLPDDFDEWSRLGCDGWGWRDMKRCFEAIEHATGGPLRVTAHPGHSPLCDAAIAAAETMGIDVVDDLNGAEAQAIGYQPRTIHRGRRQSASVAFLAAARRRPNLEVLLHHDANRVIFDGTRAVGVELVSCTGQTRTVSARQIILCAGALNSPAILMRSGIGRAEDLRGLGIAPVVNAPEVGSNLREHRLLTLQFAVSGASDNHRFSGLGLLSSLVRYYALRSGPLAQAAFEVGGFINTQTSAAGRPDAQIGFAPFSLDKTTQRLRFERHAGALCGGYPMRPESAGQITLRSGDPKDRLLVSPNYLAEEIDRRVSIGIVRFIRALFAQPAMLAYGPRETWPGAPATSDDEIVDAFHRFGGAGFHAAGTCRMGSDQRSVVDTHTRVRGVSGLRVADISIMPKLVSGNTNAPAMAMAWRAAEMLESDI